MSNKQLAEAITLVVKSGGLRDSSALILLQNDSEETLLDGFNAAEPGCLLRTLLPASIPPRTTAVIAIRADSAKVPWYNAMWLGMRNAIGNRGCRLMIRYEVRGSGSGTKLKFVTLLADFVNKDKTNVHLLLGDDKVSDLNRAKQLCVRTEVCDGTEFKCQAKAGCTLVADQHRMGVKLTGRKCDDGLCYVSNNDNDL